MIRFNSREDIIALTATMEGENVSLTEDLKWRTNTLRKCAR